jgi:hypothetical protein
MECVARAAKIGAVQNCETRDNEVDKCLLCRFEPYYNDIRCAGFCMPASDDC